MDEILRLKKEDILHFFTCRICEGVIIDATALPECSHAFCRSCIVRYCTRTNVEVYNCPVVDCGAEIHPSRPLEKIKNDTTLQAVIYKLFPEVYQDEMEKRREFYRSHSNTGYLGFPEMLQELTQEEKGVIQNPSWLPKPVPKSAFVTLRYLCVVSDNIPVPKRLSEKDLQVKEQSVLRYSIRTEATVADLKEMVGVKFHLPLEYHVVVLLTNIIMEDTSSLCDIIRFFPTKQPDTLTFDFVLADITSFPDHVSLEAAILRTIRRLPPVTAPISPSAPSTSAFPENVPCPPNIRPSRKSRKRSRRQTTALQSATKMPKTISRDEPLYPPIQPPPIMKKKRGRPLKHNPSTQRAILSIAEEAFFSQMGGAPSPSALTSKTPEDESVSDELVFSSPTQPRGPYKKTRLRAAAQQALQRSIYDFTEEEFSSPKKEPSFPNAEPTLTGTDGWPFWLAKPSVSKTAERTAIPDFADTSFGPFSYDPFPPVASSSNFSESTPLYPFTQPKKKRSRSVKKAFFRNDVLPCPDIPEMRNSVNVKGDDDMELSVKKYVTGHFNRTLELNVDQTAADDDKALNDEIRKAVMVVEERQFMADMDLKMTVRGNNQSRKMKDIGYRASAKRLMSGPIRVDLGELNGAMVDPAESIYADHPYAAKFKMEDTTPTSVTEASLKKDEMEVMELCVVGTDIAESQPGKARTSGGAVCVEYLERMLEGLQSGRMALKSHEAPGQSDSDSVKSQESGSSLRSRNGRKSEDEEEVAPSASPSQYFSSSLVGLA